MTSIEHTQSGAALRSAPRTAFAATLLFLWCVETVLWVYATIHSTADGEVMPLVTAVAALLLLTVLAAFEGVEVAAIDRWGAIFPQRTTSDLARWLAARQLFVALIVTTATLLAHREAIVIPGSSKEITGGLVLGIFDLTWTGFTVLWYAQILPKHLAATNPDRYLHHLQALLFPIVTFVDKIGVSLPGRWAASVVERRLNWVPSPESIEEGPARRPASLAEIWRELTVDPPPRHTPTRG